MSQSVRCRIQKEDDARETHSIYVIKGVKPGQSRIEKARRRGKRVLGVIVGKK